jgi:hypothetical protein
MVLLPPDSKEKLEFQRESDPNAGMHRFLETFSSVTSLFISQLPDR